MVASVVLVGSTGIVIDSVTFMVPVDDMHNVTIQSHPRGACFVYETGRAIITPQHADYLVGHGATDKRRIV